MGIELGDHEALAPCPLCDGEVQRREHTVGRWGTPEYCRWPVVVCADCGLTLGFTRLYGGADARADLANDWNRRPE